MRYVQSAIRCILLLCVIAAGVAAPCFGESDAAEPVAPPLIIVPTVPEPPVNLTPAPAPVQAKPEVRALWVTRWDYTKPEHIARIMRDAKETGFNVVFFQVRGNGTVFYKSAIEPWAWELSGPDASFTGKDPGWNPLADAIREAHSLGLELHAYLNVFPAWRGQDFPPPESGQLWWAHPDWFMCDAAGNRMVARDHRHGDHPDWYSFLSPGNPEVRQYLAALCAELARMYPVDGIHFDYIRYPAEIRDVAEPFRDRSKQLGNWSYDAVSLARFTLETGHAGPEADPKAWSAWRTQQVTLTLRAMREAADTARPGLIYTAAVIANPEDAIDRRHQDYLSWLRDGTLHALAPMNYTNDPKVFRERCERIMGKQPEGGLLIAGVGVGYGTEIALSEITIAREMGFDGVSCFAYRLLFGRDENTPAPPRPLAELLRDEVFAPPVATPWSHRRTAEQEPMPAPKAQAEPTPIPAEAASPQAPAHPAATP